MIAAILSMKPAMGVTLSPVDLAIKASRLLGMLAEVAPRCFRMLTSSSVGASFAGNMTCMSRLHPAQIVVLL